jgi:hypothetical protein
VTLLAVVSVVAGFALLIWVNRRAEEKVRKDDE